jgi:hypothetical protein
MGCATTTAPAVPDFGAHYRVELQPDPPVLQAASVAVTVSYGACGGNREFVLQYRSPSDTEVDVWLRKVTPDEACDMLVTERRVFAAPQPVRDAMVVMLLRPDEDAYQLRP